MRKYEYTDRQTMMMLGRRGFLKVVGVTALAIGVTGYAVVDLLQRRSDVIKARQAGLYRDDKICQENGLTNSHQNPSVLRFSMVSMRSLGLPCYLRVWRCISAI